MSATEVTDPRFFTGPDELYAWLEAHHEDEPEVWVGFYRKGTGKQTMTWSQAVDQAICFGWIDGVSRRIDDERYAQRFTPRRKGSVWSKVNVAKVERLTESGRMCPPGLAAYAARSEEKTGIYSFERDEPAELPVEYAERFTTGAREYFDAQPPWYRRTATHWIVSAKREETRLKRLATLIDDSEHGRKVRQFDRQASR
jgi:uncharacterized protein YdeI (YjbR/CyaY-like superfamily)